MKKYKQNLRVVSNNKYCEYEVYSYNTVVAIIIGTELHKVDWNVNGRTTSPTTSKHINYVAQELNLTLIK